MHERLKRWVAQAPMLGGVVTWWAVNTTQRAGGFLFNWKHGKGQRLQVMCCITKPNSPLEEKKKNSPHTIQRGELTSLSEERCGGGPRIWGDLSRTRSTAIDSSLRGLGGLSGYGKSINCISIVFSLSRVPRRLPCTQEWVRGSFTATNHLSQSSPWSWKTTPLWNNIKTRQP